ncbi:Rv2231c family pyridoxal phosphate-dependent protein CobC [Gordonia soli]|uniref:Aminotransferase n=1 Tax=Gordonia soli NBRC 108243 TaxID=1223545 RepID=M0QMF4_9ACTN|nr:Rv2231c family pyridoxal phosphate-dependent protein CobC [Gordonia soli]GAC69461.1 putative aminotransferase [Gordonia soli NBRC 108243]
MTSGLFALDRHGDRDAADGMVDFAVNVRDRPPSFVVDALAARLTDLHRYPAAADEEAAVDAIAAIHGRRRDEVLLLAGAAEGFELLARLAPKSAALIQPSFTEPEIALRGAGVPITQVVLDAPWRLEAAAVPEDADLVVVGNPTNPTSVLHPRASIEALRRPGRIIVVDEAFADLTVDTRTGSAEPESLAGTPLDDVVVIRSVTKTFGLAGLRVGYLLASSEVIARLSAGRRHWPLGTLALVALQICLGDAGQSYVRAQAQIVSDQRAAMVAALTDAGIRIAVAPSAPFVLIEEPDGLHVRERLRARGFAVRSAANFVGLGGDHLRLAVRDRHTVGDLLDALAQVRKEIVR